MGRHVPKETPKASPRGRDARTGEFVPIPDAKRRPGSTTIEQVPKPGYGIDNRPKR